jgi:hypothetical protein
VPNGYNSTAGGEVLPSGTRGFTGRSHSDETRKKMQEAFSDEIRKKLSDAKLGWPGAWFGKTRSAETCAKD